MIVSGKKACFSILLVGLLVACGKSGHTDSKNGSAASDAEPMLEAIAPAGWTDAAASFVGADGLEKGYIAFKNAPGAGVLMRIDVRELSEGWHGIHLHNVGDCSDIEEGFKASGGHVDPDDAEHGLLNTRGPERADLPNIYASLDGRATAEIFNDKVALYPSEAASAEAGPWPLMDADGFAVIIHEMPDDHLTQPIGGAGGRVACAAIQGTP